MKYRVKRPKAQNSRKILGMKLPPKKISYKQGIKRAQRTAQGPLTLKEDANL